MPTYEVIIMYLSEEWRTCLCMQTKDVFKSKTARNQRLKDQIFSQKFSHSKALSKCIHIIQKRNRKKRQEAMMA